jgi:hypothetical protein
MKTRVNDTTVCFLIWRHGPTETLRYRMSLRRNLKCSPALVVLCIDIRTMLNKRACDIEAPTI